MKHLLLMAFVLLQTTMVSAQNALDNSVKALLQTDNIEIIARNDNHVNLPDGTVSYCKFVEFNMPTKKKSLLLGLERAAIADQTKSYNVYVKKPGSSSNEKSKAIYDYGANNEYSVTLGTYPSHNYYGTCIADPNDSIRRHAYCFVWFKDGGNYHCYYYHIYGVKPSEFAAYKDGKRKNQSTKSNTFTTKTYSDGTVVITENYDSDGNLRSSTTSPQPVVDEVKTDIDFMLQFGNLRAAFLDAIKDADAKTLQTGIVVKIARLCKENGKVLTQNERATCTRSIDEMSNALRKANADSFMAGMLQEAKSALVK